MGISATVLISFAAGVHAASYGAYKDSPHESFLLRRYVRELAIALGAGIMLSVLWAWEDESYVVFYLSTFTVSRLVTEFFKLNIRVEPQDQFRIPTQIHFFGHVVQNRILRVMMGVVTPAAFYGIYQASLGLRGSFDIHILGLVTGLMIGIADASGGAYKDGLVEGFYLRKFLKSSLTGPVCGLLLSFKTNHPLFLLLAAFGLMRMLIEFLFKICRPCYVPGKFKSMVPLYPEWSQKRAVFLLPYSITWVVFLWLLFRPETK